SIVFAEIAPRMSTLTGHPLFLTIVALLIFCGAVGKSAQFPLHVWLPDAMEGPTPISALIHAATMVAAGVYMLVRVAFIVQASQTALLIVAWIGTITAVMAALIATQQNDIKRILAYSTLSQLGYMIMAVGLASNDAAMFHLFTHAFVKALLFLGTPRSGIARNSGESPPVMTVPLIVLALLATVGGFAFFARNFLTLPVEKEVAIIVPALAIVALIVGSGLAIALYRNRTAEPVDVEILRHKLYLDEFYSWLIYWTQELLARVSAFVDRWIIDAGAVGGSSRGTWGIGALLRLVQVGNLQAYVFVFGLGVVAVIYFAVFR